MVIMNTQMNISLNNKVVLITWWSNGIGKACVELFKNNWAKVYSTYNSNGNNLLEWVEYKKISLDDYKKVENYINEILKIEWNIDILINNAWFWIWWRIDKLDEKWWDSVIDSNLKWTYTFSHFVSKNMINKKYWKILNIWSINWMRWREWSSSYNVSKAWIISLTKTMANELWLYNINVNCISPWYVDTEKQQSSTPEIIKKLIIQENAIKKYCTSFDVANLALFLVSDYSSSITGENVKIDCWQYI